MGSLAMGPRMSGYFLTWSALQMAAQMLMQQVPSGFQRVSSGGQTSWLKEQEGEPQLNLPRSGLSTQMKVPGMGPKRTLRLFPSTLLRSQKSGRPELERVSSMSVAGDCPVMPLHSTPKLLSGAPQSPVEQTNLLSLKLQPVLAQYLIATVSAGTTTTSSECGGISQPVLAIRGTPNPPIQMVLSQLFLNLNCRVPLKAEAGSAATRRMANMKYALADEAMCSIIYNRIYLFVMFSTPGIIKFFWPKDNVEHKYSSLYDIPILDIRKQIIKLDPSKHQDFILMHIGDLKQSQQTVSRIQQLSKKEVIILPDQNTPGDFAAIRDVYPNALGKMVVNGEDAHPFAKFLRRSAPQVYDHEMSGAKKTIPLGVFKKEGDRITYYSEEKVKDLLVQLEKEQ